MSKQTRWPHAAAWGSRSLERDVPGLVMEPPHGYKHWQMVGPATAMHTAASSGQSSSFQGCCLLLLRLRCIEENIILVAAYARSVTHFERYTNTHLRDEQKCPLGQRCNRSHLRQLHESSQPSPNRYTWTRHAKAGCLVCDHWHTLQSGGDGCNGNSLKALLYSVACTLLPSI